MCYVRLPLCDEGKFSLVEVSCLGLLVLMFPKGPANTFPTFRQRAFFSPLAVSLVLLTRQWGTFSPFTLLLHKGIANTFPALEFGRFPLCFERGGWWPL